MHSKRLVVTSEHLVGADFAGRRLDSFCAVASRFQRCSFRDMRIEDAVWGAGRSASEYIDCDFNGARFRSEAPGDARFVRCSFRDVVIHELFAHRVELVDCVFSGRIERGYVNGTRDPRSLWQRLRGRTRNRIAGNDFTHCELMDFAFRTGVPLDAQRLPAGPQYLHLVDAARAEREARQEIASWAPDETRRLAGVILDGIRIDVRGGQIEQLLRPDTDGDFATAWQRLRPVLLRTGTT